MPRRIYVYTEASTHIINPDDMTVRRVPGTGLGLLPDVDLPPTVVADLRRDHEELVLWRLPDPKVGERMDMLIQVRSDNFVTRRSTTVVRDVREVWGEE